MKNTQNTQSQFSIRQRLTALVTLLAFLFQTTSVAYAGVLSTYDIESAFAQSPEFIYSQPNSDYMYEPAAQLDANENTIAYTAEGLYERFKQHSDERLPGKTLVPIMAGGITTFIPTYTRYKQIGTPYVQSRYIRSQVYNLLRRQLINDKTTEATQLRDLYNNAYNYANNTKKFYGDILDIDPKTNVYPDMVWPELHTIHGQKVIVPVLYLNKDTVAERKVDSQDTYFGGSVSIGGLELKNVKVRAARDSFINLQNDLIAYNSKITSDGPLKILASGDVKLLSSRITAENGGGITIGARNVEIRTVVHRYDYNGGSGNVFGEIAGIYTEDDEDGNKKGDIKIRSYGDIAIIGGEVNAKSGGITFSANGSISVGPVQIATSESGRSEGWKYSKSEVDYLTSSLKAKGNIELSANGKIEVDGADIISSEGHIKLLAGLGIHIVDSQGVKQFSRQGKFGKTKKSESGYETFAIRSVLDAGKGVVLDTVSGDITLKAVDLTSKEGAKVRARDGKVRLLLTKETDHYSYQSVKKGLFTTKVKTHGHTNDTIIHNSIVGGFEVQASKGVEVEYKGDPNLSLREQVKVLSEMPGLEWMAKVLTAYPDSSENWKAIEARAESWKTSNTSISPALAAVISIAVAVYMPGIGSGFAGAIQTAAATSMASQAALALASSIASGDISKMDELVKDETFKNVAVAMVTAAAIHSINHDLFGGVSADNVNTNILYDAQDKLSLLGQVSQASVEAAAQVSIQLIADGSSFNGFGEAFIQSLAQKGIDHLGKTLAQQIGGAYAPDANGVRDISNVTRYIAHAATGCLTGALSASAGGGNTKDSESGCVSGAGGAVVGEALADLYKRNAGYDKLNKDGEEAEKQLRDLLKVDGATDLTPEQIAKLNDGTMTMKEALALKRFADINVKFENLKKRGVDLARMGSALVAFASGASARNINLASDAGANAAKNNAFFLLLPAAKLALAAYAAYETYNMLEDLNQQLNVLNSADSTDAQKKEALDNLIFMGLTEASLAVVPGGKALKNLLDKVKESGVTKELLETAKEKLGELQEQIKRRLNKCKCFIKGTPVVTPDGFKAIEKIKVGELVASKDEFTGEVKWKPVVNLFRNPGKLIYKVTLVDQSGNQEVLGATEEHPFWVKGQGWVEASDLEPQSKVSTLNGGVLTVKSVKTDPKKQDTFNFEVADYHTYFVGKKGAWVHNTCGPDVVTQFEKKIEKQMGKRGWDKDSVNSTIENPNRTVSTRDTRWKSDGTRRDDPATAYIREDGHYVVRNDSDGTIVQISNRNANDWKSPFE